MPEDWRGGHGCSEEEPVARKVTGRLSRQRDLACAGTQGGPEGQATGVGMLATCLPPRAVERMTPKGRTALGEPRHPAPARDRCTFPRSFDLCAMG